LTALRYPELELVSVPALREYVDPIKPLGKTLDVKRAEAPLAVSDVLGKRSIETRLHHSINLQAEQTSAALATTMSSLIDPRWLMFLAPTMSPVDTSDEPGLLEHPLAAWQYYAKNGVDKVIGEEKHMGSRCTVILCREPSVACRRFDLPQPSLGAVYTRTGRRFFTDDSLESSFLEKLREAVDGSNLWDELKSDGICLDGELLPWLFKAEGLVKSQFAPTGLAGEISLKKAFDAAVELSERGVASESLAFLLAERRTPVKKYQRALVTHCERGRELAELRFAPFQILASEGASHVLQPRDWQMRLTSQLCQAAPELCQATAFLNLDGHDS